MIRRFLSLTLFLATLFLFPLSVSAAPKDFSGARAHPRDPRSANVALRIEVVPADPSAGAQGGTTHKVILTWTASSSASSCSSSATPPCTFGYQMFRGTAAGAESSTPINSSLITGLTYTDSNITLSSSPTTYFYYVEASETVGTVTLLSAASNEVSAAFPGIPAAPVLAAPTLQ